MAIKSTIFKAQVAVADIDHAYYADHQLTIARHPSETDERMMVRLAALALNAYKLQSVLGGDGVLGFGGGLSTPDDPDVVLRDYTERVRVWIEVGQPEDKPLAKACSQSDEVMLYAFSPAADVWWRGIQNKLTRLSNLSVWRIATEQSKALEQLAQRSMQLQATIQEGVLMVGDEKRTVDVEPKRWK